MKINRLLVLAVLLIPTMAAAQTPAPAPRAAIDDPSTAAFQSTRDPPHEQRFLAQQAATQAALASAKEAVDKAESAAGDRFDSVNEFRATLTDQANNFVNKSTYEASTKSLEEKIEAVTTRLNLMQGQREGGIETWGFMALIAGVMIAFVSVTFAIATRIKSGEHRGAYDGARKPTD